MKTKIILIGGVLLILWLAKKKRDKAKEDEKFVATIAANEMPCSEKIDIIRYKLEAWMQNNFPFTPLEEQMEDVLNLTSNLEEWKNMYMYND